MPRHRRTSSSPMDDDDILCEILLRLPPRPSSLPRASLVSRRWRRLVSDPSFLRRFRARHRTPPLLGFYANEGFFPALDPPDRVHAARFSLYPRGGDEEAAREEWSLMTSCHGLVLGWGCRDGFVVFDPMSGRRQRAPFPMSYQQNPRLSCLMAAVVPPRAGGSSNSSGDRRSFRIVALFNETFGGFASVYSSESGLWEEAVAFLPDYLVTILLRPGSLIGSAIYWIRHYDPTEADPTEAPGIIEFDLDRQSLAVIEPPPNANSEGDCFKSQIISSEAGQLGLAVLSEIGIEFWERKMDHGWVLRKIIQSDNFLPPGCSPLAIIGYAEESKVMFLRTDTGVFMVQMDTLKSRKVHEEPKIYDVLPYSSF